MMTRSQAYRRLGLVILLYTALGLANAFWLPFHQAADELAHFQYARFIAKTGHLPLTLAERDEAGYKSYQPPLYHALVALLVGWSHSDAPPRLKFVWESPRYELARELLDTKRLANTEDELPPYRGDVLLWRLGRLVSLVIGWGVIGVSFFTALEFFSGRYRLALLAAAITAFVPAFIFYSSVLSYESLLALIVGLFFWLLVRIIKGDTRQRNFIGLGVLLGLAITAKYVALTLPLEVVAGLGYLAWQRGWGWQRWFWQTALVAVVTLLASGWWFLFLAVNFNQVEKLGPVMGLLQPIIAGGGDTTSNYIAFTLTEGEIGQVKSADIVAEPLSGWVVQMFRTFWQEPVGAVYPLGWVAAGLFSLVCGLALVGWGQNWRRSAVNRGWVGLFSLHLLIFLVLPFIRFMVQGRLAQTAQGRHLLFAVITVLPVMLLWGWQAWLPVGLRRLVAVATVTLLAVASLMQIFQEIVVYKSFYLPVQTTAAAPPVRSLLDIFFGEHLHLVAAQAETLPTDNALRLRLYWQSPSYAGEDYRRRIQLERDGVTYLDWLTYPVDGRYPTRIWEQWETIRDELRLPLADLPAGEYQVKLQLVGQQGPLPVENTNTITIATVTAPLVAPSPPDIRLPLQVEGRPVVVGASLWQADQRHTLGLPVYLPRMAIPVVWQGQPAPTERVQWLLVAANGQVYPAQTVAPHVSLFTVGPDWLPGDYRLRAEVWRDNQVAASQETGPVVTIKNERPRHTTPPPLAHPLTANFANQIGLLGYDLPSRILTTGELLPVTLVWQGLRTTDQSYTVFAKLLDRAGQAWGSAERLPADGYPTDYWLENEVVVDGFALPVNPATPPGVYWLNFGWYQKIDRQAQSLPLLQNGQPTGQTSLTIGPVKVGGPPPGVVVAHATPANPVGVNLGESIRLLGFDPVTQNSQAVHLKLYWQALAQPPSDFTVFVHLRKVNGDTVAQIDRLPVNGDYPTSVWSAGEIVPDAITLPLPADLPPGKYTLVAGMYEFASGQRLPVADSPDNSVKLLELKLP